MAFMIVPTLLLLASLTLAQNTTSSLPPAANVSSTSTGNVTAQYKLYGFHNCQKGDQQAILDGLVEAHTVLGANGNYYIDSYWLSMNAIEFFGNPPTLKTNGRRAGIKQNLQNAYSFTNGWWFQAHTTEIYCHDRSLPDQAGTSWSTACGSSDHPDPIVVAPNYNGNGNPAVMFCNDWFSLGTLSGALSNGQSQPANGNYNLANYDNRARAWITAMMLIPSVGSNPKDSQGNTLMGYQRYYYTGHGRVYATSAALAKYATKTSVDAANSFSNNADSVSWYALASYVQDKIGDYPIAPWVPLDVDWP